MASAARKKDSRSSTTGSSSDSAPRLLAKPDLPRLVAALQRDHDVVAPIFQGASIVLDKLESPEDLAVGYRDTQTPGHYQIEKLPDGPCFGYGNGPDSPKKFLHPSQLELFSGELLPNGELRLVEPTYSGRKIAFFGIRPCDSFAVLVLDKTLLLNPNVDLRYRRRRNGLFVAVINCTAPCGTCFCASMGTGPRAEVGYDLRLTELDAGFLVEPGSAQGAAMLGQLPATVADQTAIAEANRLLAQATGKMGRKLNTHNLPQILRESLEHPHWDFMKTWCIGCTNCTIVCPTCFCNDTIDRSDLTLRRVSRQRVWDSCFTWQFAEVHGGNARPDLKYRYRHWATHKLGYWVEQYGVSGCVGCGRCLTWCPVGIDITEVAAKVRGDRV